MATLATTVDGLKLPNPFVTGGFTVPPDAGMPNLFGGGIVFHCPSLLCPPENPCDCSYDMSVHNGLPWIEVPPPYKADRDCDVPLIVSQGHTCCSTPKSDPFFKDCSCIGSQSSIVKFKCILGNKLYSAILDCSLCGNYPLGTVGVAGPCAAGWCHKLAPPPIQ